MRRNLRFLLTSAWIVTVILISGLFLSVSAQDKLAPWEKFDFTAQMVKAADLNNLALDDLKFLRGIVFGRHGRVFKDADIKAYLENQSWYKPNPEFRNSMLNDVERNNVSAIKTAEANKGC